MKIINYLVFLGILCAYAENPSQKVSITVENPQEQKMKLLIGLYNVDQSLKQVASIIKEDLDCALQKKTGFNTTLCIFNQQLSKSMLKGIAKDDFSLVVVLEKQQNDVLGWRIIDTAQGDILVAKKTTMQDIEQTAHKVADALWFYLTGQQGIFSTYIAFCKDGEDSQHRSVKNIYYQHPFSSARKVLVKGGKLLAPRWNNNAHYPLLLYSQVTPSNIRLMSIDMEGHRKIISNFDGINMLPSCSKDGQHIVYCFTRNGKSQLFACHYDKEKKTKVMHQITYKGNNISPNLCENGDIIFCSDAQTGTPHIYYYHADTKQINRLTEGSYCASPSFFEKTGKIAYCKLIKGVMQVCVYDLNKKQEEQITFDPLSKDECNWSACGTYLVYSCSDARNERIALLNLITREQLFISGPYERCSYPTWSGFYIA